MVGRVRAMVMAGVAVSRMRDVGLRSGWWWWLVLGFEVFDLGFDVGEHCGGNVDIDTYERIGISECFLEVWGSLRGLIIRSSPPAP